MTETQKPYGVRVYALSVALDRDVRDDDLHKIADAIKMVKGVAAVAPEMTDVTLWVAESRARAEMLKRILDLLIPDDGGDQ